MALDKNILEELKAKLLEEKTRLEDELSRIGKPTGSPGDYKVKHEEIGSDSDENASEVEEYVDNLGIENKLETQLKEVNDALERMKNGIYGFCDNCKKEIDVERLRAYPAAKTCIKC